MVVRANGEKTYFASDIAYHWDKLRRGHELLIDVWGADHHGYVARVRGALVALGYPGECFEACLMQLVSLFRGGEKLSMGKREGNFVTLRDLLEAITGEFKPRNAEDQWAVRRDDELWLLGAAAVGGDV